MKPSSAWSTADKDKAYVEATGRQRAGLIEAVREPKAEEDHLRLVAAALRKQRELRADATGPGGNLVFVRSANRTRVAVVSGEIVTVEEELGAVQALADEAGVTVERVEDGFAGTVLLRLRPARRLTAFLALAAERGVELGPNEVTMEAWRVKQLASPEQANVALDDRPAPAARATSVGGAGGADGSGIVVGVIDGGFGPDDALRTDGWLDGVVPPSPAPTLLDVDGVPGLDFGAGHGTFVTGVVRQVAPACEVRQYAALNTLGVGSTWRLIQMIGAAVDDGCRILNLSLGYEGIDASRSPAVSRALHAVPDDTIVVAAAGNAGSGAPVLPACHARVVAVGALTSDLDPAEWSNHGPWVDCACVGEGIISTFVAGSESSKALPSVDDFPPPNPVALWSGTSFAAPQVTGLLARHLSEGATGDEAVAKLRAEAEGETGRPHPAVGHRLRIL